MRGRRFLVLAQHWFDDYTVTHVFEPLLADWQRECAEQRGSERLFCRLRGSLALLTTFALMLSTSVRRPSPSGLARSAWSAMIAFTAVGTALLMVPWLVERGMESITILPLLIPSSLAIALPLATVPAAVMVLTNSRWHPAERRRTVVRTTVVSLLLMVAIAGWASPLANDAWRRNLGPKINPIAYAKAGPPRGTRELTLAELARRDSPPGMIDSHLRGREYHMRLVVITMPLTLTILAFGIARRSRGTRVRVVACWLATPILWLAAWFITTGWTRTSQQSDAIVWLAPALMVLFGAALFFRAPQRSELEAAHGSN